MCCSGTTRSPGRERGFVLATTLLVTTLLTVMLAAAFLLVSAEQRMTTNSFGTAKALAIAQAGLQNYFSQSRGLDTSSTYDSTRIVESGGYADVVGRRVRPAGATTGGPLALWVVRSSGVATKAVLSGQTQGAHTLAQFAQFNPGQLPARAAMIALNGVAVVGPPGQPFPISGHDLNPGLCGSDPGAQAADTFAVNVPMGGLFSTTGSASPPVSQYGIPMVDSVPFPASTNLYDTTHVDWAGLLAGNFTPDYTYPPGPWPPDGGSTYLVGYVAGDVTLPVGQKRGMLVVTGNVTAQTGTHWDGIIIAGGNFTTSPASLTSYDIHGMLITGLNVALGQSVPPNRIRRGQDASNQPPIEWAWCYTQSSVNSLASLVPIKNAWVDTWSTY
jgi:Tfp pilus assembly protein PilX